MLRALQLSSSGVLTGPGHSDPQTVQKGRWDHSPFTDEETEVQGHRLSGPAHQVVSSRTGSNSQVLRCQISLYFSVLRLRL